MFIVCETVTPYNTLGHENTVEAINLMNGLRKRLKKLGQDVRCFTAMGPKYRHLFRDDRRLACFYLNILSRKRALAFDIGANRGNYSKVLAALFNRVIAFEPQKRLIPELRHNLRNFKNIEIVNCAVSDQQGVAQMFLSKNHELSSLNNDWMDSVKNSGRNSSIVWGETVKVPTRTLKSLVNQYGIPDFTKVDTEGNELKVFSTLDFNLPFFSFEIIPETNQETSEILKKLETITTCSYNIALENDSRWAFPKSQTVESVLSFLKRDFVPPACADVYVSMT
jgi:FkbM family methyltransferase